MWHFSVSFHPFLKGSYILQDVFQDNLALGINHLKSRYEQKVLHSVNHIQVNEFSAVHIWHQKLELHFIILRNKSNKIKELYQLYKLWFKTLPFSHLNGKVNIVAYRMPIKVNWVHVYTADYWSTYSPETTGIVRDTRFPFFFLFFFFFFCSSAV